MSFQRTLDALQAVDRGMQLVSFDLESPATSPALGPAQTPPLGPAQTPPLGPAYSPTSPRFAPSTPPSGPAQSPTSPRFAPSTPPSGPAYSPSSPRFAPTSPPSGPAYSPTSPRFAPSSPPSGPAYSPLQLDDDAFLQPVQENPYKCPDVDRYSHTKSTTNKTLPSFVKVWASQQFKPNKPHINRLDGRGRMTRFEKAKLLGFRATRLEAGDPPRLDATIQDTVFTIAEKEFALGLLNDYIVDRVHPDGTIESIQACELAWIE